VRLGRTLGIGLGMAGARTETGSSSWAARLRQQLPLLGHRNWIGIVDAAYPLQCSPGIEMILTGAAAPEVIGTVLAALAAAPHVEPIIYTDAELAFVAVEDVPGVASYRHYLRDILAPYSVRCVEHEQIIAQLSRFGEQFNILLLKTTLLIPYASVFFELGCGYWTAAAEARMRSAIANHSSTGKITLL
jgi:hypothetical protein